MKVVLSVCALFVLLVACGGETSSTPNVEATVSAAIQASFAASGNAPPFVKVGQRYRLSELSGNTTFVVARIYEDGWVEVGLSSDQWVNLNTGTWLIERP
jgi:hypothetical protein